MASTSARSTLARRLRGRFGRRGWRGCVTQLLKGRLKVEWNGGNIFSVMGVTPNGLAAGCKPVVRKHAERFDSLSTHCEP